MLLWPLAMLLLAMPEVTVSGDAACRPPPREFRPDTNVYVCPPVASGLVGRDIRGPTYTKSQGNVCYGVVDPRYYSIHGYASFDLSGFPDSADCVSARLLYYQYTHSGFAGDTSPPNTSVVLIPDVGASAQQLFGDVSNGSVVDPRRATPDGWLVRSFNSAGLAAVDSCVRANDAIDLGISGGTCAHGAAYGVGPYHPLRAHLEVRYSTTESYHDIVALDAAFDSFPLVVGDSIVVTGHFTNTGNRTAFAVPVYASCTGTTGASSIVDSLAPDETVRVRVALPPAAEPGIASLVLCSDVQGDWCRHNDTAIKSTYVFPHGTRSAEDFEPEHSPSFPPAGWVVSNGGDTNTWYRAGPGDRHAHAGEYYACCSGTEDWLITYGLMPTTGRADTVGVFVSSKPGRWCYPQVWALGSQDPHDPIDLLLDTVVEEAGWHELRMSLDRFDGRTVHIGFRALHTSDPWCLDDVWFTSERIPSVEEPPGSQVSGPRLALGQNPVTGDKVVIRYQLPNSGPLLVEAIDALGRIVARKRLPTAASSGEVNLTTDRWSGGAYFFRVRVGASSATAKCVVQRGRR